MLPVATPSKLPVNEPIQAPDSNENATDAVQPQAETIEVKDINEDDSEEICINYNESANSGTRSSDRRSRQTRTNTTRFNIGHENVKKYGYHGDIHMQTADAIKDTFLATNDITPIVYKDQDSYIMGVIMT